MSRILVVFLMGWLMALSSAAPGDQDGQTEPGTASNPFDDALQAAKEESKYLFVAVYSEDCAECRRLDTETLGSPEVSDWMEHRANLLHLSTKDSIGSDFASAHRVESFPTVLFMSNDGRELGRQVGFADAEAFLRVVHSSVQGRNILGETPFEPWAGKDVVVAAMKHGIELTEEGKYPDALAEFVWCLDHRAARSPLFPATQLPKLIDGLALLGKRYPPAAQELNQRVQFAEDHILKSSRPGAFSLYMVKYGYLATGREGDLVGFYDRMAQARGNDSLLTDFARLIYEQLLEARRYEDLRYSVADPAHVSIYLSDANANRTPKSEVRRVLAARYEVLLGLGETREAASVASQLRRFDSGPLARVALVEAALRAGEASDKDVTQARLSYSLTQGKDLRTVMVLAKAIATRDPKSKEPELLLGKADGEFTAAAQKEQLAKCREAIAAIRAGRQPESRP